jgi:hypothetical protein
MMSYKLRGAQVRLSLSACNQPMAHEEVLAEFGLTMADWEKMGQEPLPEETPRRNG